MITLVGATGTVGKPLTQALLEAGESPRILTRDAAKARQLWPSYDLNIVEVSFDDPSTLERAFWGSERAFLATGTSDRQVRDEIALIDAAVQARVGHIVALSVAGNPQKITNRVHEWHHEIDAHLRSTGVPATWLKPTTFTDTLGRVSSNFIRAGAWGGAAGDGRVAAIDTRDVAAVAAKILLEGKDRHAGKSYDLSGPSALSMPDFAREVGSQIGRSVVYAVRTRAEQRAVLESAGVSELLIEVLLGLDEATRHDVYATPTPAVFELTGKEPRSVPSWIAEHVAIFR